MFSRSLTLSLSFARSTSEESDALSSLDLPIHGKSFKGVCNKRSAHAQREERIEGEQKGGRENERERGCNGALQWGAAMGRCNGALQWRRRRKQDAPCARARVRKTTVQWREERARSHREWGERGGKGREGKGERGGRTWRRVSGCATLTLHLLKKNLPTRAPLHTDTHTPAMPAGPVRPQQAKGHPAHQAQQALSVDFAIEVGGACRALTEAGWEAVRGGSACHPHRRKDTAQAVSSITQHRTPHPTQRSLFLCIHVSTGMRSLPGAFGVAK